MAEFSSQNDSERAGFTILEWMLQCGKVANSVWHRRFPEEPAFCFWTYGFLVYDSLGQIFGSNNPGRSNSNKESSLDATRLGKCDWCVYDDLRRRFFEALPPKLASFIRQFLHINEASKAYPFSDRTQMDVSKNRGKTPRNGWWK